MMKERGTLSELNLISGDVVELKGFKFIGECLPCDLRNARWIVMDRHPAGIVNRRVVYYSDDIYATLDDKKSIFEVVSRAPRRWCDMSGHQREVILSAMRSGSTIEKSLDGVTWEEDFRSGSFSYSMYYRVKEKQPELRPGDKVKVKNSGAHLQTTAHSQRLCCDCLFV